MIVDDHTGMRGVLCGFLSAPSVELRECSDGSAALETFGSFRPDWVIMDTALKGANGLEITQQLTTRFPDARILLMSDDASRQLTRAAQARRARGFLTKDRLLELLGQQSRDLFDNPRSLWMNSD
jgi:two-component system response regulator DegU